MCNRCQNIKAQTILRAIYRRLLGRTPTIEEMQDFSKYLPKTRSVGLSKKHVELLEIELEYIKGQAIVERLKQMSEDEWQNLRKSLMDLINR